MDSYSLGMIASCLIAEHNTKNSGFHDHRTILNNLVNSLSSTHKKSRYWDVLCESYNDNINDSTKQAVVKYLKDKDSHEAANIDINSNDAEVLIRVIPLVFYIVHHSYLNNEKRYGMIIDAVSLTHRHPISVISALIYSTLLQCYIENKVIDSELYDLFKYLKTKLEYRDWLHSFDLFIHIDRIKVLHREDVANSMYILDTLIISAWSVTASFDFDSSLDILSQMTDNNIIHVIAGALRGARYGIKQIKEEEINKIKTDLTLYEDIIKRYEQL